jgi:hypothetical protein
MSNEAKLVVREEVEPVDDDGIASSSSDHSSDSAPTTNPDRAQSTHSRGAGCDSSNETKGCNDGNEDSKVVEGARFASDARRIPPANPPSEDNDLLVTRMAVVDMLVVAASKFGEPTCYDFRTRTILIPSLSLAY